MLVLDRAIDLDFYRQLLGGMTFDRLFVCGLGLDDVVRKALAPFKPVFLDLPAIETLELLTRANRIVLANSTFSWWGAYLSEASEVYFPRLARNFWGRDRTDVDLEVPEDRYRYIDDVPVQTWRPFRLRQRAQIAVKTVGASGHCIVFGAPPQRLAMNIPQELVGFAQWLAALGTAPFGMHEVHAHDLSPADRRIALKLLLEIHRHGSLDAPPRAIEAVAGYYGVDGGS